MVHEGIDVKEVETLQNGAQWELSALNMRFGNFAEGQQRAQARKKLGSSKAAFAKRQVPLEAV